jgi:hypothetical protein
MRGGSQALLTLSGQINEIQIVVGESGKCRLVSPEITTKGQNLNELWFTPALLLQRLSYLGLNFRGPSSLKQVDIDGLSIKVGMKKKCSKKGCPIESSSHFSLHSDDSIRWWRSFPCRG